jgi:hypothetical protein
MFHEGLPMTRRDVGRGQWLPVLVAAAVVLCASGPAVAQPAALGTFRWQLLPYCNVLTLTVVPQGGEFQVDGIDDQCGAGRRAAVTGRAFPNPDGSIGFGLSTVTTPGATGVHVDATIAIATLSGTWRDSLGQTGGFGFRTGAGTGGTPRPVAASGLPAGVVRGEAFAAGTVGAEAIAPAVQGTELSAMPHCEAGQYLRGTTALGRPVCQAFRAPTSVTLPYLLTHQPYAVVGSNGLPLIAHYDGALGMLRMTRCDSASCESATTSTLVSDMQPVWISLDAGGIATVIGRAPYSGGTGWPLRVLRCGDSDCASGNSVQDVAEYDAGNIAIVAGVNGLPIITFINLYSGIRQVLCGNPACNSGNLERLVATPAPNRSADLRASLRRDTGQIVVVYETDPYSPPLARTYHVTCDTTGCTPPAERPAYRARKVAIGQDGLPVGIRREFGAGVLDVAHCDDAECLSSTAAVADALPGNYVGDFSHVAIGADGLPVVSHLHTDVQGLRVTHCGTIRCDAGNESATIDDPQFTVGYATFILIGADGFPLILHRDTRTQSLRVTKCWSRTCQ